MSENEKPMADDEAQTVEAIAEMPHDEVITALRAELDQANSKVQENWDMVMRTRADLDNLRKRAERDVENAHKFALERFANELLGVRDSLELGLQAAQAEGADLPKLLEGTELTLKLLTDAMAKHGVTEVNPQGQPFNPEQHQAMVMQESSQVKPNTVLTVYQKGYLLNDRLIRPAMVVVSKAPAGGGSNEGPGGNIDEQA